MPTDKETIATYNAISVDYDAHTANPVDSPLHAYYEKPVMHAE